MTQIMIGLLTRAIAIGSLIGALAFMTAVVTGAAHGQDLQRLPAVKRVVDKTYTLTPDQIETLATKLEGLQDSSNVVIGVVLVDTTQPEPIFDYSQRLFDEWKLGAKGKDNGVLIVVAKRDRKVRLHTGYGAEGAIPDAISKRITDKMTQSYFKQGNFYGGLSFAVDNVGKLMKKEAAAAPAELKQRDDARFDNFLIIFGLLLLFSVIALVIYFFRRKPKEETPTKAHNSYSGGYSGQTTTKPTTTTKRDSDDSLVIVPIVIHDSFPSYQAPAAYVPSAAPSDNYFKSEDAQGSSGGGGAESSWDAPDTPDSSDSSND